MAAGVFFSQITTYQYYLSGGSLEGLPGLLGSPRLHKYFLTFGHLDSWSSKLLAIQTSGHLEIQTSDHLVFWPFANLVIWIPKMASLRHFLTQVLGYTNLKFLTSSLLPIYLHTYYNQTITIDTTKQRSVALNADISQQQPKIFVISNQPWPGVTFVLPNENSKSHNSRYGSHLLSFFNTSFGEAKVKRVSEQKKRTYAMMHPHQFLPTTQSEN